MSRETQIRAMVETMGRVAPWPGTEALATHLYDAGYRDFDAELRARIEALPRTETGIRFGSWRVTPSDLDEFHAALTAPRTAEWLRYREPEQPAAMASEQTPPDDGTRWVVQCTSNGMFRSSVPDWFSSVDDKFTLHFPTEREALIHAASLYLPCTVRAVRRQPGARRWEETADVDLNKWDQPKLVIGWAAAVGLRPIAAAPDGPWTLVEP